MIQITTLSPTLETIKPHRLIAHIPLWEEEDPRFLALCRAIEDHGLTEPVKMTQSHAVLDADSRERWRVAKRYALTEMPVLLYADDRAAEISLDTLCNRRHLTKNQRAFLIYPLLEPAIAENKRRRAQNLQKPQCSTENVDLSFSAKTAIELAASFGISERHYALAAKLHKIYAEDPEYRDQTIVMLLADTDGGEHEQHRPMSLHGAIAGYGGKNATKDQGRMITPEFDFLKKGFRTFAFRLSKYPESGPDRARAFDEMVSQFSEIENEAAIEDIAKAARAAKAAKSA